MKRPLICASHDLYVALTVQNGMYSRIPQPYLEDILQRAIAISSIQSILHCRAYVNIDSVTHQDNVIQIPEQNFVDAATIYLVDKVKWILFLQSNVNHGEAYAFDSPVFMSGHQPEYYLSKPFNKALAQEGWHIDADAKGALGSYIRNHMDQLITISRNSKLAEPPKFQVTQRLATATYQQYQLPQIDTKNVIDEFMKFWETN
jgi:hypothetical protein